MLTKEKREELEKALSKAVPQDRIDMIAILADKLAMATSRGATVGECLQAAAAMLPAAK